MHRLLIPLLLFTSLPAFAVICKTVDDQGNVSYSDVPADQCQHKVRLPEVSTFTPRPLPETTQTPDGESETGEGESVGYTEMRIDQPEADGTVRSNQGQVPVSVVLEPALQQGHQLRLLLDGIIVQPGFDSQTVILSGVERGTHTLQAQVVDAAGVVLQSAGPLSFTLQRTSVATPARPPGGPQPKPAVGQ